MMANDINSNKEKQLVEASENITPLSLSPAIGDLKPMGGHNYTTPIVEGNE